MKNKIVILVLAIVVLLSGCVSQNIVITGNTTVNTTSNSTTPDIGNIIQETIDSITTPQVNLKTFTSESELQTYLKERGEQGGYFPTTGMDRALGLPVAESATTNAGESKATDYSTTNIQVAGVDEADIVKNNGKYIYTVSRSQEYGINDLIHIIDAYPASSAKILSTIKVDNAQEIFINQDKLVVFGVDYNYLEPVYEEEAEIAVVAPYYSNPTSFIKVYDISDRSAPTLSRDLYFDGNYYDSRMIGDHVYVILNQWFHYTGEEPIPLPRIIEGEDIRTTTVEEIYYSDDIKSPDTFTTIVSLDLEVGDLNKAVYLMDSAHNMYVSQNNIYTTHQSWNQDSTTIIHKIAISNGQIQYQNHGEVNGYILNQFSMDEHEGNFRIATTSGSSWDENNPSQNNIYVLNEDMQVIGSLENLAPGERIYSARFMGNRGYLVTFKQIDPLFVIDLSVPTNPTVLGQLKIPGYSDYLHPYDENHLIGLGKETIESKGEFSWFQGVKLSLFDVSDASDPKEIAKVEIGDRGTDSLALNDHKAFLFSKERNLLVLPITLAEIDESDYVEVPDNAYGEYVFQGAFVFDITLENGFTEKGRVTHVGQDELLKTGYYFRSDNSVHRSLYMDNTLYTISNNQIKMNDLEDLTEINSVTLETS